MARVLISMQEKFLKRIDEIADKEQRSRSELIREALRSYIRKNNVPAAMVAEITNTFPGQTPPKS